MDGENNGKAYEQMDDLGVFPYFWVDTPIISIKQRLSKAGKDATASARASGAWTCQPGFNEEVAWSAWNGPNLTHASVN